ncbi:cache domain-containing protein [Pannonibacter sp. Pt2-lr]
MPTANAAPSPRKTEDRGMVILAATPVTLADGRKAALTGGLLLNQNLVFIDTINDLVYRQGSLPEGSEGTATLFLDDVRISTNVRLFEGKRALGTRVSDAVRKTVLDDGITWRASAFVVNDWYVSAYEPILDSEGQRAGMLYVGFLETPFTQARQQTVLLVVLALLAIGTITVPIFLRWARAIFRPLEKMAGTISRVEAGDMGARTHAPSRRAAGPVRTKSPASPICSITCWISFRSGMPPCASGTNSSTPASPSAPASWNNPTCSWKPPPASSSFRKSSLPSAKSPQVSPMRLTIRSPSSRAISTCCGR